MLEKGLVFALLCSLSTSYDIILSYGVSITNCCKSAWLKTAEIHPLTILNTRSPKSRCCLGHTPSTSSQRRSVLPPPAAGGAGFLGLWLHLPVCLHCHTGFFSSPCLSVSESVYKVTLIGFSFPTSPEFSIISSQVLP